MLTIYQHLLRLYPAAHREQFGEEMRAVFYAVRSDHESKAMIARARFYLREVAGLIRGAAGEHLRNLIGPHGCIALSERRFAMRNGFRFPKTTSVLMTIILAGVVLAIKRGEEIAASLPHVNPQIGPIQPAHSTLLPPIVLLFVVFYAAGAIGWIILFALRRSGIHRLAEMASNQK